MNVRSVSMGDGAPPADVRELDAAELRVLGSLLEKQQTTPEYYPMTMNALIAACNQKSNRDPIVEMSEDDVASALERLGDERLVRETSGSRASRFEHLLEYRLRINRAERALLTVMMLRGPQTVNELKTRTERMHPFTSAGEIEQTLEALAERTKPLAVRIGRRSGQKEDRWMHTLGAPADAAAEEPATGSEPRRAGLAERVAELEARVERLEEALRRIAGD